MACRTEAQLERQSRLRLWNSRGCRRKGHDSLPSGGEGDGSGHRSCFRQGSLDQGLPGPFKMGGGGERHGKSPKANPAYSDGRLFTTSITGILSAWDADSGKLLWRKIPGKRFGQPYAHWGATNSPLILGDRIINLFGNDEEGSLMALDVATGETIWSMGNDGTCYSSPFLAEIEGVRQVVAWNHRALVSVEPEDGHLLWEYPFPHKTHNQNMPTPAFHDGKILLEPKTGAFMPSNPS